MTLFATDDTDAPAVPSGGVLAPFGRRALGAMLDYLLVVTPVAVGFVLSGNRSWDELSETTLLWLNVVSVALAFVYEAVMIGVFGRTVGKIATGTRVVDRVSGGKVGWFAAVQRALVPSIAAAVPELGIVLGAVVYGMAAFGPLRQGLHDRAAGTVVILDR